jgi:hypothetical protein
VRIVAIAGSLLVGTPGPADSQTAPPTTQSVRDAVRVGQAVRVTTADGRARKGVVFYLSASMLELLNDEEKVAVSFGDVSKVEVEVRDRLSNGIRNGVLAGAASAAVVGLYLVETECGHPSLFNSCTPSGFAGAAGIMAVFGAGIGAVAGWAVDASKYERRVVYSAAPSVSVNVIPLVSTRAAGVGVVARW